MGLPNNFRRTVSIRPNRIYRVRNGGLVRVTKKHAKWKDAMEGFFKNGERPFVWMRTGKYLHGVGQPHPWDLVADMGLAKDAKS